MAYKKKTITAGKVKEVTLYHESSCQSPKRPKNKNVNKKQDDKKNERRACKKLYLLMNANFKTSDLYLTLTYSTEPSEEEAKKERKKFIRKLHSRYQKSGIILKYIAITEGNRTHHHILINSVELNIEEIKKMWKLGFIKIQLFMGEPEDCERLANYFMKKSKSTVNNKCKPYGKRWSGSESLVHPVPEVEVVPAGTWRKEPKPIKGYYIDVIIKGFTQHNYPYQFYRMIKIPGGDEKPI